MRGIGTPEGCSHIPHIHVYMNDTFQSVKQFKRENNDGRQLDNPMVVVLTERKQAINQKELNLTIRLLLTGNMLCV